MNRNSPSPVTEMPVNQAVAAPSLLPSVSPLPLAGGISIMGATTDIGNRGVAALAASLVKLLSDHADPSSIVFLLPNRSPRPIIARVAGVPRQFEVVNLRISPKAPIGQQLPWILFVSFLFKYCPPLGRVLGRKLRWVQQILASRMVGDIRGGDSFSDIYGWRRLVLGSLPLLAVYWLKNGFVLFPQTYGPFKHPVSRWYARLILNRASLILSRDRASLETVQSITNGARSAAFCPDVAFSLDSIQPESPSIEPPLPIGSSRVLVGINVNGLMYNGGYSRANMFGLKLDYPAFLPRAMASLLEDPHVHVLLIPHTFANPGSVESDLAACLKVRDALPASLRQRISSVASPYDQNEIKGIIGLCDFFVGSRMHACIAALSQGIPAIGVAYSKKFEGVFETVGAQDWVIDGRFVETAAAVDRTLQLFRQRQELRPTLVERVSAAQRQLRDTFYSLSALS